MVCFDTSTQSAVAAFLLSDVFIDYESSVTCIDVRDDHKYVLLGFKCGSLILFNVEKNSSIVISEPVDSPVLSCKLTHTENTITVFNSLQNGETFRHFKERKLFGFLDSTFVTKLIFKTEEPVFLIQILPYSYLVKNGAKHDEFLDKTALIAFCSSEEVSLYSFEPQNVVFKLNKPDGCWGKDIPFVSFGVIGADENGSATDITVDNTFYESKMAGNKLRISLCVSWGRWLTRFVRKLLHDCLKRKQD